MLSLPLLDKIQQGGVDVLKALNSLKSEKSDNIWQYSCDNILMIDEMYLKKSAQ